MFSVFLHLTCIFVGVCVRVFVCKMVNTCTDKKKPLCIVCLWFVCVWFVLCVHARRVLCVSFIIMCMWSPLSHHSNHNMTLKLVNSLCGKLGSSIVLKDFWDSFLTKEVCDSVNSKTACLDGSVVGKKLTVKGPNRRQIRRHDSTRHTHSVCCWVYLLYLSRYLTVWCPNPEYLWSKITVCWIFVHIYCSAHDQYAQIMDVLCCD